MELRTHAADLLLQIQEPGVHLTAQLIARLHHPPGEALLYHHDQIFPLLAADLAQQIHQRLAARIAQLFPQLPRYGDHRHTAATLRARSTGVNELWSWCTG